MTPAESFFYIYYTKPCMFGWAVNWISWLWGFLHLYAHRFSCLWVLWCKMKWIFGLNMFLQVLNIRLYHLGECSDVCQFNSEGFPQTLHWQIFTPLRPLMNMGRCQWAQRFPIFFRFTEVLILTWVRSQVFTQVGLLFKGFSIYISLIGFLTWVSSLMPGEMEL